MSSGSPVHFGKGSCKDSGYSPTQSLLYHRSCYRVGGTRCHVPADEVFHDMLGRPFPYLPSGKPVSELV